MVAEAFADGKAWLATLKEARFEAGYARWKAEAAMFGHWDGTADPAEYLFHVTQYDAASVCEQATKCEVRPRYRRSLSGRLWELVTVKEGEMEPPRTRQARYEALRDIMGNPFRAVALSDLWLTPEVTGLAHKIYEQRSFDQLPTLAAALKEAGCAESEILDHCSTSVPHMRGCWVLDRLLQKA